MPDDRLEVADPFARPAAVSDRVEDRANPYVGPRAFRYGERIYGRDREALDLRDLLIAERIVLLYSPSGAGKTSLIRAGLVPEMEKEDFEVLPVMRVGKNPVATARNRYTMSALLSLEELLPPEKASSPGELGGLSFSDYLERRQDSRRDSTLLIFDQFEEILTSDPLDQEAKVEFFNQVGAVLRDPSRWALFSIREDYVAALDPYLRALPTRLKSTLRLDLLTADCARLAIKEPARELGVEFTEEATTRLVDDLREVSVQGPSGETEHRLGPYVEPVQLQVVCFRLWEKPRPDPKRIRVEEVAATGDVDSALAEYYAERVQKVASETRVKERVIREWVDRCLITEAGIRSEVMRGPESSQGLSNVAVQELQTAHLIRREERRGVGWLELSHDRLVKPIRADNARWFAENLSLLQQQTALWHRQNRSEALCLRGEALIHAEKWAKENADELNATEKGFLEASQELRAAEEHARSARRLRRWTIFLVAVLIIAGVMITIALLQRKEAIRQRNIAKEQATIAREQATIASARGLAAVAHLLLEERLDLGVLLGYEALREANLPETRGTLLAGAFSSSRLLSFLHGHQAPVGAVAFTPDGKLLAAGDYSKRIVLWNVATHRPERVLKGFFKDVVRSIAFSPDKKYMAASSKDGSIILRDLKSEEIIPLPAATDHPPNVWSIAFSPDSNLLASSDTQGVVTVWDVATRKSLFTQQTEAGQVRSVAFNATGTLLAAGGGNGHVLIWQKQGASWVPFDNFPASVATEQEKKDRGAQITCVAFSPKDANLLASGSNDWTVTLRDVAAKRNIARGNQTSGLNGLAFSPDGILVTASKDSTLRLWKIPEVRAAAPSATPTPGAELPGISVLEAIGPPFAGHVGWILAVAFSSDRRTITSGGIDQEAILWDSKTYLPPEGPGLSTTDFVITLSPGGKYEVTGYRNGDVICRDRHSGSVTYRTAHTKPLRSVGFSRDGRFLISSSTDDSSGTVIIEDFNSASNEPIRLEIGRKITVAALSADGKMAAIAANGGEILLWDVANREQIGTPLTGLDQVWPYAVTFSPDGKRVAAGGNNQSALVWDTDSHELVTRSGEHNGSVRAIQFSPDGKIFATAGGDATVLLWNSATGKQVGARLTGHRGPVVALAFSPDGKMLASGSEDKTIILWEVEIRQQVGPRLVRHMDSVRTLNFSENGNELFSGSYFGDAAEWDLDPISLAARCKARINRNLTDEEWEVYMGEKVPYRKIWADLPDGSDKVTAPVP